MQSIDHEKILWKVSDFHNLRPARSEDEYLTHLAAIEWGLDPSILISSAEDIQSREHWKGRLEPYKHQVQNLITFCRRAPVALIADDVGLGKTISAGLILSELRTREVVNSCLIIAPKLLGPQWEEELKTKFHIPATFVTGANIKTTKKQEQILITTYQTAAKNMEHISKLDFEMLILDEAHHLRNLYGSGNKPPIKAQVVSESIEKRDFRFVVMLTATPIQNRLWDLYSLVDILARAKGHTNPFGTEYHFAQHYLADGKTKACVLKSGRQVEFRQILSQYIVRTRRGDCDLDFPTRKVTLEKATPSPEEIALYEILVSLTSNLNALSRVSLAQALMSSPQAMLKQINNMSRKGSLILPQKTLSRIESISKSLTITGKEDKLLQLLRKLSKDKPKDWRAVIFTSRTETQDRLGKLLQAELPDVGIGFIQGSKEHGNQTAVSRYSEDPPRVNVILSTDAGAEGVNLQKGNVLINFDLPWNPMVLEQRIGRVQRLGSDHQYVVIMNLVVQDSVEEKVIGRLSQKLTAISATIGDVEGILETLEPGNGDKEDGYENTIQQLIMDALAGKDVELAVQKRLRSIEEAKRLYEEEQEQVEKHLGELDAMHREGPTAPKLSPVSPRLTEKGFTLKALGMSEGHLVHEKDRIRYIKTGSAPEYVCFSRQEVNEIQDKEPIFGGPKTGLYKTGQKAFEKLVSQWESRGHLYVRDGRKFEVGLIKTNIQQWLHERGFKTDISIVTYRPLEHGFKGSVSARTAATVAHDKYEKLVEFEQDIPTTHQPTSIQTENLPLIEEETNSQSILGEAGEFLKKKLLEDSDISGFTAFYQARLKEELHKTSGKEHLVQRAKEDFTPTISTRIEGIKGVMWALYEVDTNLLISATQHVKETFLAGSWGEILEGPELEKCSLTGRILPKKCISTCAVSGENCLITAMKQSEISKKYAKPKYIVRCEGSGKHILTTEAGISDVSGKTYNQELLISSASGKQKGTREELELCEATHKYFAPSELALSEVSGKRVNKEEMIEGDGKPVKGHISEFIKCALSGKYYLESEMGCSDFSGLEVPNTLLFASELLPHRKGLESETQICEISGRRLLKDEIGVCTATGKKVGLDLLASSALSNKPALPEYLFSCEQSGSRVLGSELGICERSKKRVRVDLLCQSDASGMVVLETLLIRSASGQYKALPEELEACEWDGGKRLPKELGLCRFSGLRVSFSHLQNDILKEILTLKSMSTYGEFVSDDEFESTRRNHSLKIKLLRVRKISNYNKTITLYVGEKRGLLFGLGTHLEFVLLKGDRMVPLGDLNLKVLD